MKTNKRHWSLIVHGNNYSLSNNTDSDPMTDYSPGMWGIKTQKQALKWAREILADGDSITVTDYDNPRYHAVANKFIKELGLNQPLFTELATPKQDGVVTNGKPDSLNSLKKYLTVGRKVHVVNYDSDGNQRNERDSEVLKNQTNSVVFSKFIGTTTPSWLDYGKPTDWTFSDSSALQWVLWSGEGYKKSTEIFYQD
jgi:hypothetical protein